jgi:hypothetical protein
MHGYTIQDIATKMSVTYGCVYSIVNKMGLYYKGRRYTEDEFKSIQAWKKNHPHGYHGKRTYKSMKAEIEMMKERINTLEERIAQIENGGTVKTMTTKDHIWTTPAPEQPRKKFWGIF